MSNWASNLREDSNLVGDPNLVNSRDKFHQMAHPEMSNKNRPKELILTLEEISRMLLQQSNEDNIKRIVKKDLVSAIKASSCEMNLLKSNNAAASNALTVHEEEKKKMKAYIQELEKKLGTVESVVNEELLKAQTKIQEVEKKREEVELRANEEVLKAKQELALATQRIQDLEKEKENDRFMAKEEMASMMRMIREFEQERAERQQDLADQFGNLSVSPTSSLNSQPLTSPAMRQSASASSLPKFREFFRILETNELYLQMVSHYQEVWARRGKAAVTTHFFAVDKDVNKYEHIFNEMVETIYDPLANWKAAKLLLADYTEAKQDRLDKQRQDIANQKQYEENKRKIAQDSVNKRTEKREKRMRETSLF